MPAPLGSFSNRRYALVIDAGSSGSRLQIYSWRDPKSEKAELLSSVVASSSSSSSSTAGKDSKGRLKGKGKAQADAKVLRRLPRVEKGVQGGTGEWQKKVEPGISSLANAPISVQASSAYLAPLIEHALSSIPPSHHSSTPIYILATAGMRLLPSSHSDAILSTTCQVLREQTPFMVGQADELGPCGDSVRIISGEEEGLWGWVAVNYLMDGFGDPHELVPSTPAAWENAQDQEETTPFGFLDMGGASTQIAFAPSADEAASHADSLSSVKLRLLSGEDMNFDVFVASWLGYGTNKARERYVGLMVEEWEAKGRSKYAAAHGNSSDQQEASIPDPCLPTSLTLLETPKLPLSALTTSSTAAELQHAASPHTLTGTGSFDSCLRSLQPLLNKDLPCPKGDPTQCLFGGLSTPHINFATQRFIGVSEYWYSSEHVFNLGGAWDFDEFERKAGEFCREDWTSIEHRFEESSGPRTGDGEVLDKDGKVVATGKWGPEVEISRLKMQCFKAAWLVNVLHEGIGLPRTIDAGSSSAAKIPPKPPASPPSSLSDLELEAAFKASEKGLGPAPTKPSRKAIKNKDKPHFQSVDTVGDTAISWTLGKMVIEASRDVQPRTASLDRQPWFSLPHRLDRLVDGHLSSLRPDGSTVYIFFGLVAMLLIFLKMFKIFRGRIAKSSPLRRLSKLRKVEDVDEEEKFLGGGSIATTTNGSTRPGKSSTALGTLFSSVRRGPASTMNGGGNNGGWNDVPTDMLPSPASSGGASAPQVHRSGILTPPATSLGSLSNSRNSSRVDLTGLTGRNFSRANMRSDSEDA